MRSLTASVLVLAGSFMLPPGAMAQTPGEQPRERLPEEITVTGQKGFGALQKQIHDAEDQLYGLFNELNTNDLYDIHCVWQAPIGTRIRQRVCRPTFYVRATEREATAFLGMMRGETGSVANPIAAEMAVHYPILQRRMEELVQEYPELRDALELLLDAQQQLNERKSASSRDD